MMEIYIEQNKRKKMDKKDKLGHYEKVGQMKQN